MEQPWGISSANFAFLYLYALAVVGLVTWKRSRRTVRGRPVAVDDLDDYDVAMMTGGPRLAAAVALVNLDRAGSVALGDRLVRELAATNAIDVERLEAEALVGWGLDLQVTLVDDAPWRCHPVEKAVHDVARTTKPRVPQAILAAAADRVELVDVRRRLVERGAMIAWEDKDRIRARWRWFAALLGVGLVRLAAELSAGGNVVPLALLLAVTVAGVVLFRSRVPDVTRQGARALAELRRSRDAAPPALEPLDRHGAALVLATLGAGALWAMDRPLAMAVGAGGVEEEASQSWWSRRNEGWNGSGCGWMWSGGSGGGGGCGGGGGGCGGGGGGCGGGGCGGGCGGGGCGGG